VLSDSAVDPELVEILLFLKKPGDFLVFKVLGAVTPLVLRSPEYLSWVLRTHYTSMFLQIYILHLIPLFLVLCLVLACCDWQMKPEEKLS
jgi:hypothetical protein